MKDSVRRGLAGGKSFSGLVGGDAKKVMDFTRDGDIAGGRLVAKCIAYSIAVLEENSRMGIIVAAPTAGAAGMVPGTLLAISEERGFADEQTARGLVVAGGFGALVAAKAELSGAAGGCQAEQGVGAAMAAGALAFLLGGTPAMSVHAAALTLQNTLGLACDPVAGLVEVPCVVRNGFTAMLALAGAADGARRRRERDSDGRGRRGDGEDRGGDAALAERDRRRRPGDDADRLPHPERALPDPVSASASGSPARCCSSAPACSPTPTA